MSLSFLNRILVVVGVVCLAACTNPDARITFGAGGDQWVVDGWDIDEVVVKGKPPGTFVVELDLDEDAREGLNGFLRDHEGQRLNVRFKDIAIITDAPIMQGFSMPAVFIPAESKEQALQIAEVFD